MKPRFSQSIRQTIQSRAGFRCEYCQLPENLAYSAYHIDHIRPVIHGGSSDSLDNLAWACMDCNTHKGTNLSSIDFETQTHSFFYHPRTQQWDEHFRYTRDGVLHGLTPEGRITVRVFDMNGLERVEYRRILFDIGEWPLNTHP